MEIRTLPIDALKPAPYNPRVELQPGMAGYERLARSLDEFDLVQPVVWNERTGHVVGGHQRLAVLKARGVAEVPTVVVSLPIEREMALNVALNNAAVGGEWDPARLVDVLAELDGRPDFDATLTGFDADELRSLVLAPDPEFTSDPQDDEDEPPTVRVTFEVPADEWESLRPRFDALIAEAAVPVHIKLPE